jgi:hypothetical protein
LFKFGFLALRKRRRRRKRRGKEEEAEEEEGLLPARYCMRNLLQIPCV